MSVLAYLAIFHHYFTHPRFRQFTKIMKKRFVVLVNEYNRRKHSRAYKPRHFCCTPELAAKP